jgi:hypothetical protein
VGYGAGEAGEGVVKIDTVGVELRSVDFSKSPVTIFTLRIGSARELALAISVSLDSTRQVDHLQIADALRAMADKLEQAS